MKNQGQGAIIELKGNEFFEKFIENEIYEDYQFLLISTDIESRGEYKNVTPIPRLIPNSYIMEYFMEGRKKQYKREYENFLRREEIRAIITVIMKSVIVDKFNIVLMCSEEEKEYKYIKMIRKFIEKEYKYPTYSYKEYCKARKENDLKKIDNEKAIQKQVESEIKRFKKLNISLDEDKTKLKKAKKQLEAMDKKSLRKFCKENGYKKYKDLNEKELREYIMKKLKKSVEK